MDHFQQALGTLLDHKSLDQDLSYGVFREILEGSLDGSQIGAILALLATHHSTSDELTGAARAMRDDVTKVHASSDDDSVLLDTCGTGGAPKTFNVSTAAAIILAAVQCPPSSGIARIRVAKHGNRSRTGRGSAEVLIALGVNVDASVDQQSKCLDEAGVCFCFAVNHHPAIKHAMPTRRALPIPTIFNAIGPLTNPAGADHQLIGVYKNELVEPMTQTLLNLGVKRAMVVHSTDGLDELSTTAPTRIMHAHNGTLSEETIDATQLGLQRVSQEEVRARDEHHSAEIIRSIVSNEPSAFADMALLTVAGGLVVAGACEDFASGLSLGKEALANGRAQETLDALVTLSNQ
ncbi:MAG: anthranilate phosphoribosyltransferase [Phycisphaerales bacterium]|nr:anthranilate phosphoribosyltransferase [Phycisphaerales bacterium]